MDRLIFEVDLDEESQDKGQKSKIQTEKDDERKEIKNNKNSVIKNKQLFNQDQYKQIDLNVVVVKKSKSWQKKNLIQKKIQCLSQLRKNCSLRRKSKRKQKKINVFQDDYKETTNYQSTNCIPSEGLSQLQDKSKISKPIGKILKKPQQQNKRQQVQNHTLVQKQNQSCKPSSKYQLSSSQEPIEKAVHKAMDISRFFLLSTLVDPLQIYNFLMAPITRESALQFQVQRFKNFMSTEYFLCFQHGQSSKYVAYAKNNTISFDKSVFTISLKLQNTLQSELDNRRPTRFIGQLVSNFKRTTYTLYNRQNYNNIIENVRILCTVTTVPNLMQTKLLKHELYIPRVQKGKKETIYNNTIANNLKKMYRIPETSYQVQRLTSHVIPVEQLEKLQKQQQVIRNTTRNAVIKDEFKIPKFYIVKVDNNCFKLHAHETLTPIEIFSYVIVHLQ